MGPKQGNSLKNDVIFHRNKRFHGYFKGIFGARGLKMKGIAKGKGKKKALQIMKTIRTSAENPKVKVYFGRRHNCKFGH